MIDADLIGIIELGDIKIKCIIVKINNENFSEILSSSSIESQGIHNGTIVNIAKASDVVRLCISEAEKKAEVTIKKINVVIEQPEFLCTKLSKDRKINGSKVKKADIEFLLKEAKKQVSLNDAKHSIIHIFNHNYIVDGKIFIEEPIDVYADYLSHETTFITMPKNNIKNLNQTFINCDIEVERFISSTFALAIELLNQNDLSQGSILIDIGFEKTSLGIFKNLALVHSFTFPIGKNHIVKDISKVCSLSTEETNALIQDLDFSFKNNNQFFDEKNCLKKTYFNNSNYRKISKTLLLDVVKARIDEIFDIIKKQIFLTGFNPSLGQKIFIFEAVSNLLNMDIYLSNFFGSEVEHLIKNQKIKNKNNTMEEFSSCLGALKLIKNGWETEAIPEKVGVHSQNKGFFSKIFSKFS
tara:strand:+ start:46 stop:1281 length:1236 start_codon:yes stop_codon:yes gene_type:complete